MHPLVSYLKAKGIRRTEFVERLRASGAATLSVGYIGQIVIGHRHPSRELARQIEVATDGEVSAAALLLWERPPDTPDASPPDDAGEPVPDEAA